MPTGNFIFAARTALFAHGLRWSHALTGGGNPPEVERLDLRVAAHSVNGSTRALLALLIMPTIFPPVRRAHAAV